MKIAVVLFFVFVDSLMFSQINASSFSSMYCSTKTCAGIYQKTFNGTNRLTCYNVGFKSLTKRNLKRQEFLNLSLYNALKVDVCEPSIIQEFFDNLYVLKFDTIMPYDTKHINSEISVQNKKVITQEEIDADLRCMVLAYRSGGAEIIWFSRMYAFVGSCRFKITEGMKNFIDKFFSKENCTN